MVGQFDYVVTMEDLTHGQRIGNYSIEFKRKGGDHWETLVPAVQPNTTSATATTGTTIIQQEEEEGALVKGAVGERDRPDGHDPRDQVSQNKRRREQDRTDNFSFSSEICGCVSRCCCFVLSPRAVHRPQAHRYADCSNVRGRRDRCGTGESSLN